MKTEVLTHGRVPVARPLPWDPLLLLGSTGSQRWVKGGDLIKPRVIVMLVPSTQLLTSVSTTSSDLPLVGVHCKGGTGRSNYSNRFFAKKHLIMADTDLFGSKAFLEWSYKHGIQLNLVWNSFFFPEQWVECISISWSGEACFKSARGGKQGCSEKFLRKDQGFDLDNMTTMENEILWE